MAYDMERLEGEARARFQGLSQRPALASALPIARLLGVDLRVPLIRMDAYIMATVHWETGGTFRPIREYRASAGTRTRALQDRYWSTGYFGRGYVQLTWRRNYAMAGERLAGKQYTHDGRTTIISTDSFLLEPQLLLVPVISYDVLVDGMVAGWFTGKRLGQYIVEGMPPDYVGARRVVNGTNKAGLIAGLANTWELVLRASKAVL